MVMLKLKVVTLPGLDETASASTAGVDAEAANTLLVPRFQVSVSNDDAFAGLQALVAMLSSSWTFPEFLM